MAFERRLVVPPRLPGALPCAALRCPAAFKVCLESPRSTLHAGWSRQTDKLEAAPALPALALVIFLSCHCTPYRYSVDHRLAAEAGSDLGPWCSFSKSKTGL